MDFLKNLETVEINSGVCTGIQWMHCRGTTTESYSPVDGSLIALVGNPSCEDYEEVIRASQAAFPV